MSSEAMLQMSLLNFLSYPSHSISVSNQKKKWEYTSDSTGGLILPASPCSQSDATCLYFHARAFAFPSTIPKTTINHS